MRIGRAVAPPSQPRIPAPSLLAGPPRGAVGDPRPEIPISQAIEGLADDVEIPVGYDFEHSQVFSIIDSNPS